MLRIANGSALELDTALTLLAQRGACRPPARAEARTLTVWVVAMLTTLRHRAAPWVRGRGTRPGPNSQSAFCLTLLDICRFDADSAPRSSGRLGQGLTPLHPAWARNSSQAW